MMARFRIKLLVHIIVTKVTFFKFPRETYDAGESLGLYYNLTASNFLWLKFYGIWRLNFIKYTVFILVLRSFWFLRVSIIIYVTQVYESCTETSNRHMVSWTSAKKIQSLYFFHVHILGFEVVLALIGLIRFWVSKTQGIILNRGTSMNENIWIVEIGYHCTHRLGSPEQIKNKFFKCGF